MLAFIFSRPALVAEGSQASWVGLFPFIAALVGYLSYRQPNPIVALTDIGRGFIGPLSSGRGWLVGVVVTFLAVAILEFVLPAGLIDRHQWLVWGAVAVGAIFGYSAHSEPNLLHAGLIGLRRSIRVAAAVAAGILAIGFFAGGVYGVYAFLTGYGILGVIAILLALIVFQLERLVTRR